MTDEPQLPEAELAALADGSLPADRRAQLRARIEASPELAAALRQQERAVTMLRAVDEPAPTRLRARVGEMTDGAAHPARPRRAGRWRRSLYVPAATALAVAVGALVVLFGGGARVSSAPTIPQTAHLALAAATLPAPAEDPAHRGLLRLRVGGLAFPYYGRSAGWRATGARTDTIRGRRIVTVFYTGRGRRVGYAIVAGAPLGIDGGTVVTHGGVTYWLQHTRATELITWRQGGHTCVIAGRRVSPRVLLTLASAEQRQAARAAG